jgi:hypothetical protein
MTLTASLEQLTPSFSGRLLQPADPGFDEARRVHNGLVDKRPALIACCRGVADVADSVKLARTLGLEVAVRGGGHNVAGKAAIDAGVMIDLAPMKGIHVDPGARTVRAQGGVLWKELNRETQLHGLATTGGVVASTGIAGLTLGGGIGWLMPKYGLALDNLRSAEMVMADGSVCRASAGENPDLFWAIRGGGGNFGIAASLEFDLHPVGPIITGGLAAHPFQKGREVLQFFRETCASAPDELMLVAGLLTAPDGSGAKLVGIIPVHCGSLADGDDRTDPVQPPEHTSRCLLSERRAQLLEGFLSHRLERRCDCGGVGVLLSLPISDEPDRDRALPREGEPDRHHRNGVRDARLGIQRGADLTVDRPGAERCAHCLVPQHVRRAAAVPGEDALRELPRDRRVRRHGRRGCLRPELRAAPGAEDQVRSGQFLSRKCEHPAALNWPDETFARDGRHLRAVVRLRANAGVFGCPDRRGRKGVPRSRQRDHIHAG